MGAVRTIVDTAWADIQSRFGALAAEKSLPEPKYAIGADWFSRLRYPVLFLTTDYIRQETSAILGEEVSVALDLVLVHTAGKADVLETAMIDYTDCLLELIRDDHTFGGACQIGEFVSSDLYAGAQDGWDLGIALLSILLRQEISI